MARYGSSPRVRGTLQQRRDLQSAHRFIPACAGNAPALLWTLLYIAVHPRVCGERRGSSRRPTPQTGSSPRVRGTLSSESRSLPSFRFIPACAGNARITQTFLRLFAVHPRVCGERVSPLGPIIATHGSSPRVRGTRHQSASIPCMRRFIPACAGNASGDDGSSPMSPVHPRVCGERLTIDYGKAAKAGSSPRVRGTLPYPFP